MPEHASPIRRILALSWPMLVAQLASIGMVVTDTVLAGRYATADLAAVAVGSGLYIAVSLTLAGVIQALAPIVSHLYGAKRHDAIAPAFQQGIWLALALAGAGALLLAHPGPMLRLAALPPDVEAIARGYLLALAFGLPAVLAYRSINALGQAIGRPRPLMAISVAGSALHVPLACSLMHGGFGGPALGGVGCGISTALVSAFNCTCGGLYLALHPACRDLKLFRCWRLPTRAGIAEQLRLGAPMAMSNLVEISGFTLIALFVARLGPEVVAGHRLAANLAAVSYMLPLALASGTLVLTGQALGAGDATRARATARAGIVFGAVLGCVLGLALAALRAPILGLYGAAPAALDVALALTPLVCALIPVDAAHTLVSFTLRAYKVTTLPMLAHAACFWGVGLAGGYVLAFSGVAALDVAPLGAAGFWIMLVAGTTAAFASLAALLAWIARRPAHAR